MRALTVCVDYQDYLRLTLPLNRRHFSHHFVVTDEASRREVCEIAAEHGAVVLTTDAFTRGGACFNKWAAVEYALSVMGRQGWLCLLDADVAWPSGASAALLPLLRPGSLYCPLRHMMPGDRPPAAVPPEAQWLRWPIHRNVREHAGYSLIFNAADPHLGDPPWLQTDWRHAGGADSFLQARWPEHQRVRPPFRVLHMGPAAANWMGRATPRADGSLPPEAGERAAALRGVWEARRRAGRSGDAYAGERLP